MSYLILLGILISAGTLLASLYTLHKVRKIHLATYDLLAAAEESHALFAQIQSLHALERLLALERPLPPLRGWAGSPDFLLRVCNETLSRKPAVAMECSSGVSTVVIARCLQINGRGHVYSLEHEPRFAEKTRQLIASYGLADWATVLDAPLETTHTETPWYSERAIPPDLPPIELLVVDGPPATTAPMARLPALPRLLHRMAPDAVIIADDTRRDDETRMIERWKAAVPNLVSTDLACEKGCVMLELHANEPRPA